MSCFVAVSRSTVFPASRRADASLARRVALSTSGSWMTFPSTSRILSRIPDLEAESRASTAFPARPVATPESQEEAQSEQEHLRMRREREVVLNFKSKLRCFE